MSENVLEKNSKSENSKHLATFSNLLIERRKVVKLTQVRYIHEFLAGFLHGLYGRFVAGQFGLEPLVFLQ